MRVESVGFVVRIIFLISPRRRSLRWSGVAAPSEDFETNPNCRICAFYSYSSVARFLISAVLARPFLLELFWLQSDLSPPARMQCGHRGCHLWFSSVRESQDGPPNSSRRLETRF